MPRKRMGCTDNNSGLLQVNPEGGIRRIYARIHLDPVQAGLGFNYDINKSVPWPNRGTVQHVLRKV